MKLRHFFALSAFVLGMGSAPAFAHHFWVVPDAQSSASKQIADIVYGHDFPNPEEIPAERTGLFEPLKLVTEKGETAMGQAKDYDNYHYSLDASLNDGAYLIRGDYKPTFWTNGDKGWQMVDKTAYKGEKVEHAEEAVMAAKAVLEVGTATDSGLISKPLGQKLEIVPLAVPGTVKVGERLPIEVLFDGKPLKFAEVKARYAGFGNDEEEAYYGRTDIKGQGSVVISHKGVWAIEVRHTVPHSDPTKADELIACSTLVFRIK